MNPKLILDKVYGYIKVWKNVFRKYCFAAIETISHVFPSWPPRNEENYKKAIFLYHMLLIGIDSWSWNKLLGFLSILAFFVLGPHFLAFWPQWPLCFLFHDLQVFCEALTRRVGGYTEPSSLFWFWFKACLRYQHPELESCSDSANIPDEPDLYRTNFYAQAYIQASRLFCCWTRSGTQSNNWPHAPPQAWAFEWWNWAPDWTTQDTCPSGDWLWCPCPPPRPRWWPGILCFCSLAFAAQ